MQHASHACVQVVEECHGSNGDTRLGEKITSKELDFNWVFQPDSKETEIFEVLDDYLH